MVHGTMGVVVGWGWFVWIWIKNKIKKKKKSVQVMESKVNNIPWTLTIDYS